MTGDPVVIEAAINGVTTKAANPHSPLAPEEIAADALACFAAGAAIVHNHVDVFAAPGEVAAQRYLEGWQPILAERPDSLLYPTANGGPDVETSYAHITPLAEAGVLRISLCDPGSVNLGGLGDDGLPVGSLVYTNSFDDIRFQLALCRRHELGPSLSIFEPGFLRAALAWWRAGELPAGAMVKLYFGGEAGYLGGRRGGASFGLPPTAAALDAYLDLLDGCDLPWSAAVLGGDVLADGFGRLVVERGGHLRVGLEDYAGERQPVNEELVREAVAVCEAAGRPVATCDEAAALLRLPLAARAATRG
jgi:uncharacterized protein (DUF849 family)